MKLSGYTVMYGGSFDPPHLCHQMSCLYLLEGLEAQQVWMVPAFVHPFGKVLTDFSARLAMCQRLAEPFGSRVQVLTVERELGGQGRTYDTLRYLQRMYPKLRLALAIGSDLLAETPRWFYWDKITQQVPVVVIGRSGHPHPSAPLELPAIASNQLKEKVRKGEPLEGLVPASVAHFIEEHKLYQSRDAR